MLNDLHCCERAPSIFLPAASQSQKVNTPPEGINPMSPSSFPLFPSVSSRRDDLSSRPPPCSHTLPLPLLFESFLGVPPTTPTIPSVCLLSAPPEAHVPCGSVTGDSGAKGQQGEAG